MKDDEKTKPAELEPNDSQRNDELLSHRELGEISGGIRSSDPCEGGEIR